MGVPVWRTGNLTSADALKDTLESTVKTVRNSHSDLLCSVMFIIAPKTIYSSILPGQAEKVASLDKLDGKNISFSFKCNVSVCYFRVDIYFQ